MRAVIHVNPGLEWQADYGAAICRGLKNYGLDARISHDPKAVGDINVVLGPNWALLNHSKNCILIDRAFWGDPLHISINRIINGEKAYNWQPAWPREHPPLAPLKPDTGKTICLCDYGDPMPLPGKYEKVRGHPTITGERESLKDALKGYNRAIGGKSTALVYAAISGLHVSTYKTNTPVDPLINGMAREEWVNCLAWHNWAKQELEIGDTWRHFIE